MQHQFEDLKVWQKAMELVEELYKASKIFSEEERYGLTSQIRRASVSVTCNIAEGKGRFHKKEYLQFLYMARGSIYETLNLIHLAYRLKYLTRPQFEDLTKLTSEVTAMLNGLIQSLQ